MNEERLSEQAWLWYFLCYELEKRLRSEDQVLGQKCAARLGGRRGQIPSTQACICGAKWANFLRVQFRDGSYKCPIVYLGILPHILFLNKEYSFSIQGNNTVLLFLKTRASSLEKLISKRTMQTIWADCRWGWMPPLERGDKYAGGANCPDHHDRNTYVAPKRTILDQFIVISIMFSREDGIEINTVNITQPTRV